MTPLWRLQLLGALRATSSDNHAVRFRTQKAGSLLGYAAFYLGHAHPREVLGELLWPEADDKSARHSLRMAISLLRGYLEPPGILPGTVVVTDRQTFQLNPDNVTTDTADFSAALLAAANAESVSQKITFLQSALDLYQGLLLPGCYESWIVPQRLRMEDEYAAAARELLEIWEEAGSIKEAIAYARTAASIHPLREELHIAFNAPTNRRGTAQSGCASV